MQYQFNDFSIAHGFQGSVCWNGNCSVTVEGEFGDELCQIAYWRNNAVLDSGKALEFWLEYNKDSQVELALSVTQFSQGTVSEVQQTWLFTEQELKNVVVISNQKSPGPVFVSLLARGSGKLKIIALRVRQSGADHRNFLSGGKRYVTSDREEFFYFFQPGDRKPPLNVYFCHGKMEQGFEGHRLIETLGCPYLLFADPRLEEGCFYLGSSEFENAITEIMKSCMEELGFTNRQVVMSGFSMGAYAAIYYGCDILPHAMLVGEPLLSIGNVAVNERLRRPGKYPTSLDTMYYLEGSNDRTAIQKLNDRIWNKFDNASWGNSKFVVAYMQEDDYDPDAYQMLLSHVKTSSVQVYGKGIHGRHNDELREVELWFRNQYDKILREDFFRKAGK